MASISEVRAGTTNFEVYEEGHRYLGIATVDLPELSFKGIDVNGAGIAGEMNIPVAGMIEDAELTIHWREVSRNFTGLAAYKAHNLTFRSAQHLYNAATGNIRQEALKILARGIPKKITLGKLEQASETESESVLGLDYIKIWVDGKVALEFDRFNYIYKVWRRDGSSTGIQDYLSGTRQALGLGTGSSVQSTASISESLTR